jgi:hypothetical protein
MDSEREKVRHAGYALLVHGHKMPAARIDLFMEPIQKYFGTTEITKGMLEQAKNLAPSDCEVIYHGKVVVTREPNLDDFCKQWRYHFLGTMNPEFIPDHWVPDREIDEEERRSKVS